MHTERAPARTTASTAIRKYIDGKISLKEYFREVRESTAKEVRREHGKDADKGEKG